MIKAVIAIATLALTSAAYADPPPPPKGDAKAATPPPAADAKKDAPAAPATPPAAAEAKPPPPPAAELATNMKGMDGKWKCDATYPDLPAFGVKAHKAKADLTSKADLNGYFYATRYEEKKSKDNPTPYVMSSFVGFEPGKGLVRTDLDGIGMITHLSSKGWDGDKLVWAGEVLGPTKIQFKETITKKGDKEMSSLMEMAGADGNFASLGEIHCKK